MAYWTFDKKNALQGVEGTTEALEGDCNGGTVTHPDPDDPAILSAANIVYALQTSRRARDEFRSVYPTLPADAQARLATLITENPRATSMVKDDQRFADQIQSREVRGIPVRTCGRRGGKGYGGGS